MSKLRSMLLLASALAFAACSDDEGGTGIDTSGPFGAVQAVLADNDCRSCHNPNSQVYHGAFNLVNDRAADSAMVLQFLNFVQPAQSPLALRPLESAQLHPHPMRAWSSLTSGDGAQIVAFATDLAEQGFSRDLVAVTAGAAPAIDGVQDAGWSAASALTVQVSGGFYGSRSVTMRAMYDAQNIYMLLTWTDPSNSLERAPFYYKTASGWLRQEITPAGFNNAYLGNWTTMPAGYYYEDKVAIIWNTTGSSAIANFDNSGCSIVCHVNQPGDPRPLKYTNFSGEIGDMWHWKLVRTNVVHRLDDQLVYWNRSTTVNSGAGRAGDPGGAEYTSNPLTGPGGMPRYVSGNQPAAPYYMVDSATAAAWAAASPGWAIDAGDIATLATVDNFAVGDRVAYAVTTLKPNVDRSDVEAYGVYSSGTWTLEIRRKLNTGSVGGTLAGQQGTYPVDVQFAPGQTYAFGLAIFDNAQIEHSWSPAVYRLRFQQ